LLSAFPRGALVPAVAGTVASFATDLTLVAYFLAAEALSAFSTAAAVALDLHSRARALDLAAQRGIRDRVEAALDHRAGVHALSARIGRFVGNALLVAGFALVFLRDHWRAPGPTALGVPWGALGATLAVTFFVNFLLNDLVVRNLAARRPSRLLVRALPALDALAVATTPIRLPLVLFMRLLFRVNLEEPAPSAREEVLETVEEGEREGSLTAHEAEMIESIIDLGEATVDDILTSRGEIAMVQGDASLPDAVRQIVERGHRRLPVYGKDRDDVVGVLHAFDLLAELSRPRPHARVRDVMRPPFFVPAGKPLNALLAEMRARRSSMAIVTNEYGGVAGLVTIADVLQEIVGEIGDEMDEEEQAPTPAKDGSLVLDGRTSIEDLNEMLAVALPASDDYETVGGLLFHEMGRVPGAGDRVILAGVALTVTDADERTVKQVRVERLPPAPAP